MNRMGIPTFLTHKTSNVELPAEFHAVDASVDRYITFLSYTVPAGCQVIVGYRPILQMRLYTAGGVLITSGRMLIGLSKPNKALISVWNDIPDLSNWAGLTWLEQLDRNNFEAIRIDSSYDYCLCYEREQIVFQIKNASHAIPEEPHASTKFNLPVNFRRMQDVFRMLAAKEEQKRKARGIDAAD